MANKAFITGGTGFLGLNLIEGLIQEGWEVYALHRKTSDLTYLKKFPVNLIVGSISDIDSLRQGMPNNLDAVFHVAGNTNMWRKNNETQYQDNVIGTRNMVKVALEKKAKKFICTSSISAFGTHNEIITEETPSNAENYFVNYHKTKFLAEKEVDKAIEQGLDAVILNPCHIMGKYDKNNWAQLIKFTYHGTLPGIPPGRGNYCYAKDVAKAHINAVENGKTGERYLLGGVEAGFLNTINVIEKLANKPQSEKVLPKFALKIALWRDSLKSTFNGLEPNITPEKFQMLTKKSLCNDSKAQKELDYQHTPLEVMVTESFNWLKEENML